MAAPSYISSLTGAFNYAYSVEPNIDPQNYVQTLDLTGLLTSVSGQNYLFGLNEREAGPNLYKLSGYLTPVPEASQTVSLGLLLALRLGGMVVVAKRKKAPA